MQTGTSPRMPSMQRSSSKFSTEMQCATSRRMCTVAKLSSSTNSQRVSVRGRNSDPVGTVARRITHDRCTRLRVSVGDFETKTDEKRALGDGGDDYYSVLGVSPNANLKEIKKAYYDVMRDFHPDISTDEDSNEFCIFLNEVYETLSDPEKRAAYDEIAGFDVEAVNPFLDTSFPRDQVFVDEFACIGCRNCCNVCPKSFGLEDVYGRARVTQQNVDSEDMLQEAIDTCPVNCIHWVTSPQLALLEDAMTKMERIAVYSLMLGGGAGVDVFKEASTAFEKRQAEIQARRDANKQKDWMEEVGFTVEWRREENVPSEYDVRRRAAAAQAAASARRWRDFQRKQSESDPIYLPPPSS